MSPEVTAFNVAVVSPFPPKFIPPDSLTVNGFAESHTASAALPSSVGAAAVLATTSVLGGTVSRSVQAASDTAANVKASLVLVNMVTSSGVVAVTLQSSGDVHCRYRKLNASPLNFGSG